jgi:hypothetical protein
LPNCTVTKPPCCQTNCTVAKLLRPSQGKTWCLLDLDLGIESSVPSEWFELPLGCLKGWRLDHAAWVAQSEARRSARALEVTATDGVQKLNRKNRLVLSTICKTWDGALSSVLCSLVTTESEQDCQAHFDVGLPLFYGAMRCQRIGVMRVDGGFALNTVGAGFVARWCNGGPYPTVKQNCGYHAVEQVYLREYTGVNGKKQGAGPGGSSAVADPSKEDDGLGRIVMSWIWEILRCGWPDDHLQCWEELRNHVAVVARRNPHTDSLLKLIRRVHGNAAQLSIGNASIPSQTPTRRNQASLCESDNFVMKKYLNGQSAKSLTNMAGMQAGVARARESRNVS